MDMKISLNVLERLTLIPLLPKDGNIITIKMVRDLNDKLGFDADELKELEITQEGEMIKWNPKGNLEKELTFKIKEYELIKDSLLKLDKENKLTVKHISLYDKFKE